MEQSTDFRELTVALEMVLWLLFNCTFIRTPRLISLALLSNQRIESWWSLMRRDYTGWIINFGRGPVYEASLLPGNLHMECVWFVFSRFLQDQLNSILKQRNSHHIRKSQDHKISGVPYETYYLPENFEYKRHNLVASAKHINNILQQKILMKRQIMSLRHKDLQHNFWYVVNCEKLPFPPTTWEEANMIFKGIIEKASTKQVTLFPALRINMCLMGQQMTFAMYFKYCRIGKIKQIQI